VNRAWEQSGEDLLGGAAAFCVLGGEIFAFGRLNEVDIDEANALLLGKADGRARGLALGVVGHGLWRTSDFADDVGLLGMDAADASYEAARGRERLDRNALREVFGGEQFLDDYFKFLFGSREHACGDFFGANLKQ
jgi:hypothetical protein